MMNCNSVLPYTDITTYKPVIPVVQIPENKNKRQVWQLSPSLSFVPSKL